MSRYFNFNKTNNANVAFNIIIGGRGTGKTYGALTLAYKKYKGKFLYLRRQESEVKNISNPLMNPFKVLNRDNGWNVQATYSEKDGIGTFYEPKNEDNSINTFIGYSGAISTFQKLRGADLSDVEIIIFDEFMRAKNQRKIENEADAFFNTYETITRNREIMGKPPVICYIFSNSTNLNSPLLSELGLISIIEMMNRKKQKSWTDKQMECHIELLSGLEITEKKKETALYKLTKNTKYASHALENEFAYDNMDNIKIQPINEYNPLVRIEDIFIYQHKSKNEYYCTRSKAICKYNYEGDSISLFKRTIGFRLYDNMLDGKFKYSDYDTKSKLFEYYNQKKQN